MDRRKSESRRPRRLERGDLALCLFAIQIVLDFWVDWLSSQKGSTQVVPTSSKVDWLTRGVSLPLFAT
jgi:hypothetical protein